MRSGAAWIAAALSALAHLGTFGLVAVISLWPTYTPPILIEAWGNSDREGFPVSAVSIDPGAYQQGDANTPGGDGSEVLSPPEEKPETISEPAAPAEEPLPPAPDPEALALPPNTAEAKTAPPAREATDTQRPGAPGGANMRQGTPSAGGIVGKASGVRMLDYDSRPYYPEAARLAGIEGAPIIWLHISAEGKVVEARIHKSCGHAMLDESALRWARNRRFAPARRGNTPVDAEVTQEVRFYLY
jgi:protein TonB